VVTFYTDIGLISAGMLIEAKSKTTLMADNLHKKPQDGKLISLKEDWEVKYWTEALACSVIELKAAVEAVGHSAERVREYLKQHHGENIL
jgi:hypothetical protein